MSRLPMERVLDLFDIELPDRLPAHILCPFHEEDTPSCAIYEDHFTCFGCGVGGDALGFVARLAGGSFSKARAFLDGADIDLDDTVEHTPRELDDLTADFLREAGDAWTSSYFDAAEWVAEKWPHLTLGQLTDWGIGIGRYNLLIPHRDADGVVRGVKTRSFTGGNKGKKGAFTGSCFTTRLYRVLAPQSTLNSIYLMEGESDCWTFSSRVLVSSVLALPAGALMWRDSFVDDLRRAGNGHVRVCVDNDETGLKAGEKIIRTLTDAKGFGPEWWLPPPEFGDWTEAILGGANGAMHGFTP